MTAALTIENLCAGYERRPVIRELNVPALEAGTVSILTGPNGAGKSTLLRALAGLVPATGLASLDGRDLLRLDPLSRARTVGFMPQSLPGDIRLSVLDAVVSALKVSRPELSIRDAEERAAQVIQRLGILPLAMSVLGQLSGGQKQLASLAQAIVGDPKVVLLDEPASALDLHHQFNVMRTIRGLAAEGRVVVVVVHDLEMASRWADRIIVMRDGELFGSGPPAEVVTAEMLRDVYRVNARVAEGMAGAMQIAIDGIVGETTTGEA